MANSNGNELASSHLGDATATTTTTTTTTTAAVELELVSILKKSGSNIKRSIKTAREKIDPSKVVSSEGNSQDQVVADNGCGQASVKLEVSRDVGCGTTKNGKATTTTTKQQTQKKAQKPRRRVATLAQRRAANIRERRRMFNLNAAFDRLRKKVPSFAYEKRLSRIETLKLAIMYIRFMDNLVNDDVYAEKYKQLTGASSTGAGDSTSLAATSSFLSSGAYLSLYGHCGSGGNRTNNHLGCDESSPCPVSPVQLLSSHHNSTNNHLSSKSLIETQSGLNCSKLRRCRETGEPNAFKSSMDFGASNSVCQGPGQYCTETQCQSSSEQQQIQQYRSRVLTTSASPISCGSIAYCSSPNSSSATTCHSVSSATFIESPNSRSPTTIATQQGAALNEAPFYYDNNQQYGLQTYVQRHNHHHQQSPIPPRCLYPPSNPCDPGHQQQQQQITSMPLYYSGPLIEPNSRKPLDGYHQPLDASTHQVNPHSQDHNHHQCPSQHLPASGRQPGRYQDLDNNQHERVDQQVYSLHCLEAT